MSEEKKDMRCFIVGVISYESAGFRINMTGQRWSLFPTMEECRDMAKELWPSADKINVVSISEVAREDYARFFSNNSPQPLTDKQ